MQGVLPLVASALLLASCTTAATTGAAAATPMNPSRNQTLAPDPHASGPCTTTGDGGGRCASPCWFVSRSGVITEAPDTRRPACDAVVLRSIDAARRREGVRPMVLPSNFERLTTAEQLFVVLDLERVDRGLPPYLGLTANLDAVALRGAQRNGDPVGTGGMPVGPDGAGTIWAEDYSVLMVDFGWMENDGWGGTLRATTNVACRSPHDPGCWGHRDVILAVDTRHGRNCHTCVVGAAYATIRGRGREATPSGSYAAVIAQPASGVHPRLVFSWARDVVPFLARPKR